jgi:hypothetical protein
MKADKMLAAINAKLEAGQELEHRTHLGASVLGKQCTREIWYGFRWAAKEVFSGRMLRLFDRGQLEESRFMGYLSLIGCEIWPENPETGGQWRITFANGHGGGSADGIARGIPDLPEGTPFLTEFKTHNQKSFDKLVKEGLCQAKPEHFAQTQIYTVRLGLPAAVYMGVNKNDDDLHPELIVPNQNFVATLMDKADSVVAAEFPPPRIGGKQGAAFYLCRFCKFSSICHQGVKPEMNCRTCKHSKPVDGGVWLCQKYDYPLNKEEQHRGCADYHLKPAFNQ